MKQIFDILKHTYFKFGLAAVIFILWVIWLGNYWWLFGLIVIYDIYITKKVNWSFWKSREKKEQRPDRMAGCAYFCSYCRDNYQYLPVPEL